MTLTLRLAGAGEPGRTLDTGTLSIGRGADNDWVLTDPDRTLSKNHCRVDASEGGFMLTDLSTNGVFLNGAPQAVGRGHSVALEDGDSFSLGPYRMQAEIAGREPGGLKLGAGIGLPGGVSPLIPQVEEPWLTGLPGGDFGPGRRAAPQGWDAPPDPAAYAATGMFEPSNADRLLPADPYGAAPGLFSQQSEHIPAASTNMRLPEAQVVLPMDWMDGDPVETALVPSPPPPGVAWPPILPDEPAAPAAPVLPPAWAAPPLAAAETPAVPAAWDAAPAAQPLPAAADVTPPAPVAPPATAVEPPPAASAAAAPRPRAAEPPPVPARIAPDGGHAALPEAIVAAFLEGAGLPADTLAGIDQEAAFRDIGQTLRAAVEGVRDIMSTRALVKSEFRVDQTVLRRNDNNQVKFAPDAQRCLAAMVGAAPPGFLPGSAAMQKSMDDIKLHELALVAALNSVFADLGQQLDPDAIMRRARQDTGMSGVLPYAREAKCWAIFVDTYRLLQESGAANTGGSLLAPLAQAYARQLRR